MLYYSVEFKIFYCGKLLLCNILVTGTFGLASLQCTCAIKMSNS